VLGQFEPASELIQEVRLHERGVGLIGGDISTQITRDRNWRIEEISDRKAVLPEFLPTAVSGGLPPCQRRRAPCPVA